MIDVTEKSNWRFPLFFILYFIQGIVIIAVMTIVPLYFVEKAMSLPLTTLVVGIAMLPWSVKFFWGGFVDYLLQHGRRIFIVLGALLLGIGLLAVSSSIRHPPFSCSSFFYSLVFVGWLFSMLPLMPLQSKYLHQTNGEKLVDRCFQGNTAVKPLAPFFLQWLLK